MIRWIKSLREALRAKKASKEHDAIVQRYREFGQDLGDSLSYAYLGNSQICSRNKVMSYRESIDQLDELEIAYAALGYRIIPLDDWIDHGGYGKSLERLWLVKRQAGEKPVFTKDMLAR